MNPHQVTRDFEAALCAYTGAPYAVAVNSCTMAILLACAWHRKLGPGEDALRVMRQLGVDGLPPFDIPKRTYVSVPQSIIHAGGRPTFRDEAWWGAYQLKPYPIFDSARWFTSNLWFKVRAMNESEDRAGTMVCLSFHSAKTLGDTQGGAILHDSPEADAWLRRARFDGRTEGVAPADDTFDFVGWHCYLSPDVGARLLLKLAVLPLHNAPLPNSDYPDLSTMEIFK